MSRCPDSFRVGDVFIAGAFVVSPAQVASLHRARALAEFMEQPGGNAPAARRTVAVGGPCPDALLISGALSRLRDASSFQDFRPEFQSPSAIKLLATSVVGEPVSCVATVRFRSRNEGGSVFLTLGVELRRRRGKTLGRFEVGLELCEDTALAPVDAPAEHAA
jgi:hypothetical protein